jgi:hypothetical protein
VIPVEEKKTSRREQDAEENKTMKRALALILLVPAMACASAQAKAPADSPNLDVPPAPPRVIESIPAQDFALPEPVSDLPAAPATPRPRPAPPREPVRSEPKPEPAPPEQPAAPAASPTVPPAVPQLRTPGSADGAEASRQVRDVIDRAKRTLGLIDYARLNKERRTQYDTAKLLMTQSEEALKSANFDIARNLADKADRIAKELQTR